jgi:hypothetical protein
MKLRLAFAAALFSTAALAQSPPAAPPALPATFPVSISDQDTANIRQVCDIARASGTVNLETAGGVTQYCVALINRFASAAADHKKAAEAKPAEVKPPEEPKK